MRLACSPSATTVPSSPAETTASVLPFPPTPSGSRPDAMPAPTLVELSVQIARLEEQAEHSSDDRADIKRRLDLMIEILNRVAGVADQVVQLRDTAHERNNELQRTLGKIDAELLSGKGRIGILEAKHEKVGALETEVSGLEEQIRILLAAATAADTRWAVNSWWIGGIGALMGGLLQGVVWPWLAHHLFGI